MVYRVLSDYIVRLIAARLAGDIVLSDKPGKAMRKWREFFGLTQTEVARAMGIAPSVVSEYESGRRTPGTRFLKQYVKALLKLDAERGWPSIKRLSNVIIPLSEGVVDIRELEVPVAIDKLIAVVKGALLTSMPLARNIYGYTVLDSLVAIESMSGNDFWRIMGTTTERALIFTRVSTGRSPMIAVRVAPVKPAVVILHGTKRVDPLAIKLAELDGIPLVLSLAEGIEDLITGLKSLTFASS
ncbi:MAG: transcriptional regulator [Thermoprotei archaeon]|nr:MAG: transcriptional regulator [Thermoprotei archaeon]